MPNVCIKAVMRCPRFFAAVRRAEQHFEKLWTRADDVLAIVREQLERMQSNAMDNYITSYRGPFSITTPAPASCR